MAGVPLTNWVHASNENAPSGSQFCAQSGCAHQLTHSRHRLRASVATQIIASPLALRPDILAVQYAHARVRPNCARMRRPGVLPMSYYLWLKRQPKCAIAMRRWTPLISGVSTDSLPTSIVLS
jgi:hypothetical protein